MVSLAACGEAAPPEGGAPPDPAPAAGQAAGSAPPPSVEDLTRRGLLPLGGSREEIAATLGPPDSVAFRVVPNRHVPGVRDTLFDLFYPDLRIGIHHPGGGRDLLSSVVVASDRYLRFPRPGIGATREEVREALGAPQEAAGDSLTYLCRACPGAEEPVTFVFEDGRVVRIRFDYYVD